MDQLKTIVAKYCKLPEAELDETLTVFSINSINKGRYVLKPGQICTHLYILLKGTLRIYSNDSEGKEITAWLSLENTFAIDSLSFFTQTPSEFYIQAISDCELATISFTDLQQLYHKIPAFRQFGQKIAEEVAMEAVKRVVSFQREPAEKRYEQIVTKPEYMQHVLLKHLASFLGLTDTSLSRLRRKK